MTAHVLGLDLGLAHVGAAYLYNPEGLRQAGRPPGRTVFTERLDTDPVPPAAPLEERSARVLGAARWAASHANRSTTLIVVEGPAHAAQYGQPHERGGVWWRTVEQLIAWELPVAVAPPRTVKMHATGRGNADKPEVRAAMAAAHPRSGLDRVSLDEGDAAALATLGADWLGWPLRDAAIALAKWNDGDVLRGVQWPDRSRV